MMKFKTLLTVCMFFLVTAFGALSAEEIVGKWKTIDDETKKARSIVVISVSNGVASGKIVDLLNRAPNEEADPVCDKCKGSDNGKKIKGMTIIRNLKKDGNEWKGGTILDPKTGKVYKCKIEAVDGGKVLKVRGFIGFSLIGRTQKWYKM